VYVESAEAFGYHMWTEVYVGDRWLGLDGTRGGGGVSAAYLKLADTDLHAATAFSSMLPVAQVLGRLEIDVLEAQSGPTGPNQQQQSGPTGPNQQQQ
jgi:transglutaminase-like putative cysteine protease